MKTLVLLLLISSTLNVLAKTAKEQTAYYADYSFSVERNEPVQYEGYTKTRFRGTFQQVAFPEGEKEFKDLDFILYQREYPVPGVKPQLTIVLPNLSPLRYIDNTLARGFVKRGSHVLLLRTGITWRTYGKALSNFNQIILHQMLGSHHALEFALSQISDPSLQIQVIGTSLGAVLSSAALATNERITSGIAFIGGAGFKGSKKQGLVASLTKLFQGRARTPSPGIVFDTMDFKEELQTKRLKIYKTRRDLFIPPDRQRDLIEVAQDPEVQTMRGMHILNVLISFRHLNGFFEFFNPETD